MKYLKKFENINKPKVGDYVIVHTNFANKDVNTFFMSTPIKIIDIYTRINPIKDCIKAICDHSKLTNNVQNYFNYSEIYGYTITLNLDDVVYFSDNIEDINIYLQSKNYNL